LGASTVHYMCACTLVMKMKVGDLVKYIHSPELGLVIDFDKGGAPIIQFCTGSQKCGAFFMADIEVICRVSID